MSTEVARTVETSAEIMEKVVVGGDLSKLQPAERLVYYAKTCESVGLNPLTRPFEYITLNGKLQLYAKKDCTDQLRSLHKISIRIVGRDLIGETYVVTAQASKNDGREDESTGAVCITGLKGTDLANAYMKAETKAKRRVTLSISGLGLLDESELEGLPSESTTPHESRPVISMPRALSDKPDDAPKAGPPKKPAADPDKKLESGQLKFIRKKLDGNAEHEKAVCTKFGVEKLEDIAFGDVNKVLVYIGELTNAGDAAA